MKFPFNIFLRGPEDDSGNSNSGGDGSNSGASDKGSELDNSYRPEDGDVSDSDLDLYNSHQRRIGGRTTDGKLPKGTLQKALEDALGPDAGKGNRSPKDKDPSIEEEDGDEDGDENSGEEDSSKDGDKKGSGKEKPGKEGTNKAKQEEDELDIDPTTLRSKSGVPISNEAAASFNKIKEAARKYKKEAEELRAKAQSTDNSTNTEEFKKIKEELEALKKEREIEAFESSPAFIEVYEKPMEKAKEAVAKFFPKDIDADDLVKLTGKFKEAHAAAIEGDEVKFHGIVDEISEEIIQGGTSLKNAFASRMENYYDKLTEWAKAKSEKGEERRKYVENRITEIRSKNTMSTESSIDSFVTKMLADKTELLDSVPDDMRKEYVDNITSRQKTAKAHIAKMATTGEISPELAEIIQSGVAAKAYLHENKVLSQGYRDAINKVKILEERITKLQGKRKSSAEDKPGAKYVHRPSQSTEKNARRPGEGAIEYNLRLQQEKG